MKNDLIGLWHFDEPDGPVAWNAASDGAPFEIGGALRQPGQFGTALCFRNGGDNAVSPLSESIANGTVSFWLRLDEPKRGGTIFSIQEQVRIGTDKESGTRLTIAAEGKELVATHPLELGRWVHVAATFGTGGLALNVDGRNLLSDPTITSGIAVFGPPPSTFVTLCPLPSGFVPCAVDELAVFRRCLSDDEIKSLSSEPALAIQGSRSEQPEPLDISAREFIDRNDPACGLQRAIDAAYPNGGRVTIPAGRYVLRRGLRLHSRISLVGASGQTILAAAPGFESRLVRDARRLDSSIEVSDASGFAVGDGVVIESPSTAGYHATHALIAAIHGHTIELATPLWSDYAMASGAFVARWFPMISAMYQHDLCISDITIEGRAGLEESTRVEFTAAAIELERCLACHITRVQIRNWLHDGICLGKGSWHRVADCLVRDCKGHGFHPGNRMRKTTFLHNMAIHNGQDGFFFCCGVEDCIVAHNVFDGNAWNGIGDLGSCDDERNLVTANQCVNNGRAGILINGGKHNTVTNNHCFANSRGEPGKWAGIHILKPTKLTVVSGNHCIDDPADPIQAHGILEEPGCESNVVRDNE